MTKVKFGIIGCGRISARHVDALISHKDEAELVAVYDIIEAPAIDKKSQYESAIDGADVKVYTDYEAFLNDNNIDVVTIATISGYHAQQAIDCLNHNKHVLIEKPMALSLEDVDKIIALGKEKNKKVCVCHQNRFIPAVQKLKQAIDEGRFGKLVHGTARTLWARDDNYYKQASWRGTKELDGGTLMNQCIHNIDLLQWMMGGEVERLSSETDTFIRDIETEDFGAMLMRFANGAVGIVEGSVCVYPKNLEESLGIFGEKGTVVLSGNKIKTWQFADEKDYDTLDFDETNLGHAPLYKDLIDAINEDREPLVNGEEGKKAIEIILNAYGAN
ncbi:Gfo/Idh/MocA family protein [Wansuia hejianensis]|uniref:Gfo/Idh/MocA family oxidoreductase n=1 Tax=Wansuia hejianensis TaxID=2763667 RepID=A0A926IM33_9FIRM|nr:Gfo/Idh/MocA family oxidoreductase [Wansuia hejianensis]MBC8590176.1 Gfo/Idh/MocA family oxidoreductase [Wansuia hejianensis]